MHANTWRPRISTRVRRTDLTHLLPGAVNPHELSFDPAARYVDERPVGSDPVVAGAAYARTSHSWKDGPGAARRHKMLEVEGAGEESTLWQEVHEVTCRFHIAGVNGTVHHDLLRGRLQRPGDGRTAAATL